MEIDNDNEEIEINNNENKEVEPEYDNNIEIDNSHPTYSQYKDWQKEIKDLDEEEWINTWPKFIDKIDKEEFLKSEERDNEFMAELYEENNFMVIANYNNFHLKELLEEVPHPLLPAPLNNPRLALKYKEQKNNIGTRIVKNFFAPYAIKTPPLLLLLTGVPNLDRGNALYTRKLVLEESGKTNTIEYEDILSSLKNEETIVETYIRKRWLPTVCVTKVLDIYMWIVATLEADIVSNDKMKQKMYEEKCKMASEKHTKLIKTLLGGLISKIKHSDTFKCITSAMKVETIEDYERLIFDENDEVHMSIIEEFGEIEQKYMFDYIHCYEYWIMNLMGFSNELCKILLCENRVPSPDIVSSRVQRTCQEEWITMLKWKNKSFGKPVYGTDHAFNIKEIKKDMGTYGYLSRKAMIQTIEDLFNPYVGKKDTVNNNKDVEMC